MKTRQKVALIAGGCIVLVSFMPLFTAASKGLSISSHLNTYVWWIAAVGVTAAAAIILAALWEE